MWKSHVPLFRRGPGEGTEALWQLHEMLVAVLDDCAACRTLEAALRADPDAWSRRNAGVVFVRLSDDHRLDAQLAEAFEPLGIQTGTPALGIADRFGRLYAALEVHDRDVDQLLRDADAWIDFVQEQCEECGVPLRTPTEAPLADSADDGWG